MKKLFNLTILVSLFCTCSYAQDMGFRTTDIGAEYQKYEHGSIYNLHIAFNAKLNHSFQLRLGYNQVPAYRVDAHTESGNGWGGGLGYRYYFKPFPYKLFIGARTDIWSMKIDLDFSPADGPAYYPGNTLILQPALETGYTFVINDMLYITPYVSAGFQTDFDKGGSTVKYGNGFIPTAGISTGIRL
ncbi:MAG: hypothetical protein V9F01_15870 [Chitinophagaceae bacterium]